MISTNDLKEGQEVIIDIKGEPVWVAELSKDTRPGTLVSCSGEGKIEFTNTRDHKFYVGYTLEGGKAGDKVKYVGKTGVLGQSLDAGVEGKLNNGEEIKRKDEGCFYRKASWLYYRNNIDKSDDIYGYK